MKAISIMQPWAAFILSGNKPLEVRSWPTQHRGELLVCASAKPNDVFWADPDAPGPRLLHAGCMLGIVSVQGSRPMVKADEARAMAKFARGAYVWELETVCWVRPDPVAGRLRLFEVPDDKIVRLPHDKALHAAGKNQPHWVFDYPCPQGDVKFHAKRPIID